MSVTATCGHDITHEDWANGLVTIKTKDKEGRRVLSHRTVCAKCRSDYVHRNLIVETKAEQNDWLFHGL